MSTTKNTPPRWHVMLSGWEVLTLIHALEAMRDRCLQAGDTEIADYFAARSAEIRRLAR